MSYRDPNVQVVPHEPIMDVIVLDRACHRSARWLDPRTGLCEDPDHDPPTSQPQGRITALLHVCRLCGRLISEGKHV